MKKVKFVAFSDIQIEDWKRYNISPGRRLEVNGEILLRVHAECLKHNCPALFSGDLFDNNMGLSNKVLNKVFNWFNAFKETNTQIYAISGNHDQSESNYQNKQSSSYIKMMSSVYPNFINMDFKTKEVNEVMISGIPYITGNVNYSSVVSELRKNNPKKKKHILLTHTDLWGAKDSNGRVVDSVQNIPVKLNSFFKGFDLVLNGHIHKSQVIRKKILNLGATHQQRTSDMGTKMYFWLIFDDLSYKPIYTKAPEFKTFQGEMPSGDHLYIEDIKDTETPEKDQSSDLFHKLDSESLANDFMKTRKIKSTRKLQLLIKYLNHARD